jgi:hypothetical protein
MKHIPVVFASLAFFTAPALAAPGLPEQIANLQAQIDVLRAGDGTAEAIVGTWTGEHNSLVVDQSFRTNAPFFHIHGHVDGGMDVGLGPGNFDEMQPFFHTQIMGLAQCSGSAGGVPAVVGCFVPQGAFTVGLNPSFWVVKGDRGPMTITLARDGTGLIGCSAASCPDSSAATLRGAVVGNNFFLLKLVAPGIGPCGTGVFQGTAALSADRTRMLFTGAGVDSDCSHTLFSLNLRKS